MSATDDPWIHPAALCETDTVGSRTRIWAFAHVLAGARIGADCNICDQVFIEGAVTIGDGVTVKNGVQLYNGVTIGDYVFLGPACVFTNDLNPRARVKKSSGDLVATTVSDGVTIGANATIVCGIVIGSGAFVGAGAVVVKNVPAHALMVGNPARQNGWVCDCGRRLEVRSLNCPCGAAYLTPTDDLGLRRIDG